MRSGEIITKRTQCEDMRYTSISIHSTKDPVYCEEEDAFNSWWSKTPLGRRKQRALEVELEAKMEKETGGGGDKKTKKRK